MKFKVGDKVVAFSRTTNRGHVGVIIKILSLPNNAPYMIKFESVVPTGLGERHVAFCKEENLEPYAEEAKIRETLWDSNE